MLYVLHSFGPDHIRLMSVDEQGKLTLRPAGYTVNTHNKLDRVATMATLSPDERLLFVGTTFDDRATANPHGYHSLSLPPTGRGSGYAPTALASRPQVP